MRLPRAHVRALALLFLVALIGPCSDSSRAGTPSVPYVETLTHADLVAALDALAATDLPPPIDSTITSGVMVVRDRDGTVVAEGPVHAGERTGIWQRYAPSGQRIERGSYDHDRPIGTWERWGNDGTSLGSVVYGPGACSAAPPIEQIGFCGTSGRVPSDWAELGGVGELRRCAAFARPWIEADLGSLEAAWSDSIERTASPEVAHAVETVVREAAERIATASEPTPEDLRRVMHGTSLLSRMDPAAMLRLADLRFAHPRELARLLGSGGPMSVGRAARWYRELAAVGCRGDADGEWTSVCVESARETIETILAARPELTLLLTGDALPEVAGVHHVVGRLRVWRADFLLSHGDLDGADAEAGLARESFAQVCSDCESQAFDVLTRIANTRHDDALASRLRDEASTLAEAREERIAEDGRLTQLVATVRQQLATGQNRAAAMELEAAIPGCDTVDGSAGGTPWGAAIRWYAARAHLALGDLPLARTRLNEALDRIAPARPALYLQTLAELEVSVDNYDAAERAIREAVAEWATIRPNGDEQTASLEATLRDVIAARERASPAP